MFACEGNICNNKADGRWICTHEIDSIDASERQRQMPSNTGSSHPFFPISNTVNREFIIVIAAKFWHSSSEKENYIYIHTIDSIKLFVSIV